MEAIQSVPSHVSFTIFESKRNNRWDDLSDHHFTAAEKEFVAKEIIDERVRLCVFLSRHNMTKRKSTVQHWVKTVKDGRKINEFGGRPASIDMEGKDAVKTFINNGGKSKNPMLRPTQRDVEAEILKQVNETKKRKGQWGNVDAPDIKTVRRIEKEMKVSKVKGQKTTNARITATCDPRNFFTFAIMCEVCCKGLNPKLILNWDATQFGISKDDDDLLVFIKDEDYDTSKPVTGESSGDTCIFVKLYHFHNAFGTIAPPVYVIADPNLGESDFEYYEVAGLGRHGGAGNGSGFICFTKTRAANDHFYRWFNETVVIPFILQIRLHNEMPPVSRSMNELFHACNNLKNV